MSNLAGRCDQILQIIFSNISIDFLKSLLFTAIQIIVQNLVILYQLEYPSKPYTINQEIFVHENIHVLKYSCNEIFKGAPQKYFNTKICQVEITVHVSQMKRLLATYASLFCYRNS